MSVSIAILPVLILTVLALGVLVYFICYRSMINRKLKQQESEAHVPMASTESVFKVVVIIGVLVMYSSLNSKIVDLQEQLTDTRIELADEIAALRYDVYQLQESAKKEASMISGAYFEFGEVDTKEHTAEITFSVAPKSYREDTEVSVVFRGETIALTKTGGKSFTGSTIVPIFEDVYEECIIEITEGGVTKTEVWENAPQGMLYAECLPLLVVNGGMGTQSSSKSLRLEADYELFSAFADSFHDVTLLVKRDGTTVEELEFTDGRVSFEQSYSLEKGETGARIEFYLKGTDKYGYLHETHQGAWDIGEGAGNEAYETFVNRGYRVFAPDGTLLTKEKE